MKSNRLNDILNIAHILASFHVNCFEMQSVIELIIQLFAFFSFPMFSSSVFGDKNKIKNKFVLLLSLKFTILPYLNIAQLFRLCVR